MTMNEAKKQNIKRSLQDAIRHLAEAHESLEEATGILHEELELGEDKRRLRFLAERLDTYMDDLITIAGKN